MTTMILEVYDAFKSIGIDDAAARKAAGALSDNPKAIADLRSEMKDEFVSVRAEIADLRSEMKDEFVSVRAEIADLRSEMKGEFVSVRSEMASEFAKVRLETANEFAKVRGEMRDGFAPLRTEQVVVRTLLGILIAGVLSIVLKLYT